MKKKLFSALALMYMILLIPFSKNKRLRRGLRYICLWAGVYDNVSSDQLSKHGIEDIKGGKIIWMNKML
jgi:hypothetical protein